MRLVLSVLLSYWRRHPLEACALVIGLALATGLWIGVQAINTEARKAYAEAAGFLSRDQLEQLVSPTDDLTVETYIALRRAGWQVSPLIEGPLPRSRFDVVGLDPFTLPPQPGVPNLTDANLLAAFLSEQGVLFAHPSEIDDARGLAADVRPLLGVTPGTVVTDIQTAQALLNHSLTALLILPNQPKTLEPLSAIAPNLIRQPPANNGELSRLTRSFHLNLTAFGLLSFAVGLVIVYSAIGLAFEERRSLFRTLRALGVSNRQLLSTLALELGLIAALSGGLGIILGYGIAGLLLPGVAATLSGLYGAGVGDSLSLPMSWWLTGLGIALAGAAAAGGQSLYQLAKMPLLATAQPRAWAMARAKMGRMQNSAALLLLLTFAALCFTAETLLLGFAALGALLVGSALLLPAALSLIVRMFSALAHHPITEWFWADTRQQLSGLSLALMALMLALAANIGVSTMVGSFRATFTGWLDQRLAAELYVTTRNPEEAAALQARVTPALPIISTEIPLEGRPGDLFGTADNAIFREGWPLIAQSPRAWDKLTAGDGVFINEQLARRTDLWPGTTLQLTPEMALPVLGVYSDYGNPKGQAMIGIDLFRSTYPDLTPLRFALSTDDPQRLTAVLKTTLDLPDGNIINQASIKAASLEIFERTFLVTGALNVLTLGVAAFALWAALASLASMRLPQLAPIWALGLTRKHVAALEYFRILGLAGLTLAFALPIGLALAWTLLAIVNVAAFGWRLPLEFFPSDWAWLLLWTVLAASAAAAFPVIKLAQTAPARLLQVFAHAR